MRGSRSPRGSALIEALVALMLLAIAGTGLVTLLGQTAHSMQSTRETERTTRRASAELDRLALLDRTSLAASVGRQALRGWTLDITQRTVDLFDVRIAESDTSAPLLRTTIYRPRLDSASATP